jgi:hypothetical protein
VKPSWATLLEVCLLIVERVFFPRRKTRDEVRKRRYLESAPADCPLLNKEAGTGPGKTP